MSPGASCSVYPRVYTTPGVILGVQPRTLGVHPGVYPSVYPRPYPLGVVYTIGYTEQPAPGTKGT